MSSDMDLERYLALLHSSTPDMLAELLARILSAPAERMDLFQVYVPEVSLMLSRLLFNQDVQGATRLAESLERELAAADLDMQSPTFVGRMLDRETSQRFAYYLGRLQGLLILARRVPILEIPGHIRAELQDGGENQAILQLVAREGPLPVRQLRLMLKARAPEGGAPSAGDLHRRLAWLVRAGVLEADQGNRRGLSYALSPLGRRLLDERPPWMEAVHLTYRAYRQGLSDLPHPFSGLLEQLFREVDQEMTPGSGEHDRS